MHAVKISASGEKLSENPFCGRPQKGCFAPEADSWRPLHRWRKISVLKAKDCICTVNRFYLAQLGFGLLCKAVTRSLFQAYFRTSVCIKFAPCLMFLCDIHHHAPVLCRCEMWANSMLQLRSTVACAASRISRQAGEIKGGAEAQL